MVDRDALREKLGYYGPARHPRRTEDSRIPGSRPDGTSLTVREWFHQADDRLVSTHGRFGKRTVDSPLAQ